MTKYLNLEYQCHESSQIAKKLIEVKKRFASHVLGNESNFGIGFCPQISMKMCKLQLQNDLGHSTAAPLIMGKSLNLEHKCHESTQIAKKLVGVKNRFSLHT